MCIPAVHSVRSDGGGFHVGTPAAAHLFSLGESHSTTAARYGTPFDALVALDERLEDDGMSAGL